MAKKQGVELPKKIRSVEFEDIEGEIFAQYLVNSFDNADAVSSALQNLKVGRDKVAAIRVEEEEITLLL